jgi:hypothetical protein
MNNNRLDCGPPHGHEQRGNALIVVVVLLLLATLFVLFSLNVGRFEQRTSANDLRAKIVQEVAESGLSLGFEFLNADKTVFSDPGRWELCGPAETTFPCGAVPETRRGSMFTYQNGVSDGTTMAGRLLPINDKAPGSSDYAAGGYQSLREVGAVLCRLREIPLGGGPVECTTDLSEASATWVVTIVSRGSLPAEGSTATVTQTIGAYNIFSLSPNNPPLTAAGSVAVGGGLQIVASPDAAGPGVPTSVWSRLDVGANGTPNTCYLEEFLRQGGTSSGPAYYDGIEICHTCNCPTGRSLSFGKGANLCEGMDIVDIEPNDANDPSCPNTANLSIRREEFPRDLFALLFGYSAWMDIERDGIAPGADCTKAALDCHFGETRIIEECKFPDPQNPAGATITANLPADTCYLLNIRNKIHIGDGINDQAECDALGGATRGVVWVHSQEILPGKLPGFPDGCERIKRLAPFGSPSGPVALVYDGPLTQVNGLELYGLLFLREPNGSTKLDKNTGGSARLGINGNMVIYGAAVVQGRVESGGGGSAAIVHNKDVLFNLINDDKNITPDSMPGSWTDRLRY